MAFQKTMTTLSLTEANVEAHDFRLEFARESLESFQARATMFWAMQIPDKVVPHVCRWMSTKRYCHPTDLVALAALGATCKASNKICAPVLAKKKADWEGWLEYERELVASYAKCEEDLEPDDPMENRLTWDDLM